MALTLVTSFHTLMSYANAVGQAKKKGDPKEIEKAEAALRLYEELCLKADSMALHLRALEKH